MKATGRYAHVEVECVTRDSLEEMEDVDAQGQTIRAVLVFDLELEPLPQITPLSPVCTEELVEAADSNTP